MNLLYTVNPRRRRRKSSSGKRARRRGGRSAAQRAATARMLAANRAARGGGGGGKRRRRRFRRNPSGSMTMGRARHYGARAYRGLSSSGILDMLKGAAIGGAGAVAVDIGMGYASRVLPAGFATPINTDGTANWGYIGAKAALALAFGVYGRRLPVVGVYAGKMADGALTVLGYQLIRPFVPSSIALGYLNPAPTMRPSAGMGRVGNQLGRYVSAYVRAGGNQLGRGASAAQVVNIMARRDRSAYRGAA